MKFLVLCTFIAGAAAAYSSSNYRDAKATGLYNQVSVGTDYADKFPHGNTGYNGGYTTHFSGPNGAGVATGASTGNFAPGFGGFPGPTVDFNNFFQGIQANFANLYQQQFALQQALFQQQQAAFNGAFGGAGFGGAAAGAGAGTGFGGFPVYGPGFSGGSNYVNNRFPTGGNFGGASSSASYGPGGFHQTASVYPGNPAVPNVDTRFGGSEQSTSFQNGKPGIASWSEDISVHNKHYSQHESSVNAARKAAAVRLQQQQTAALVASGGSASGPCDAICRSSYVSEAGSDAETIGQGIVGFTSAGTGAVGSSQKYSASSSRMSESSIQNVAVPVVYPAVASTAGTRSSYSSSSSSRQQKVHSTSGVAQPVVGALYSADHGLTQSNVVQPGVYSVAGPQAHASQSSYERSSSERTVVNRPVVNSVVLTPVPVAGASNTYNARSSFAAASNEQQVVQPAVYPTANSDYSRRYVAQQDHTQYRQYPSTSNTYVLYSKPIASSVQYYAPSRSRTEESASSTSYDASGRVVNLNVVQPVQHSERVNEQRSQQRAESVQTVQRQQDLYPVRGSYDHQEKEAVHHQEDEYEDIVDGISTERPYESAAESQQRHVQNPLPIVVQPAPVSASSTASRYASSAHEHRTGASGPAYYAPAGSSAYSSNVAASSSHNSRYKAGSGGAFVHYPITNDEFGRRFGAVGGSGGFGADTDLQDIMSEAEALARLQAQNVHNGAVTGSGTIDADTRFGGDSEGLGTMPGGYKRTKSWSSSSKWASEQRYGEDGKPKTYSMLSTAESEKHNINGKTTGYKAATTTLEDDGKVSTYSLHTTKVATLKQNVYEKKREFLNGINERVSKMLWIPPWSTTTTEETPVSALPQHDPVPENPSIWWWQTTEKPTTSTITIDLPTYMPILSTTSSPSTPPTMRNPSGNDRLVFTGADTNELELPNVYMYARSSFIPPELRLTDSMEYVGPVAGRGPPVPDPLSNRLIVV
uniref:Uncharacterized protein n=1 Tax=Anopheles epiroticus TaxID=199890 RepID=A0A182P4T2_9DIPT